jgi:hypothetical protein
LDAHANRPFAGDVTLLRWTRQWPNACINQVLVWALADFFHTFIACVRRVRYLVTDRLGRGEQNRLAKRERPELARMLDHLYETDVAVIIRRDRLARSTKDLLDIAEKLNDRRQGRRACA